MSTGWLGQTVGVLADLVLPSSCAGCGATGSGQLCADCATGLASLDPLPARPTPAPAGLPPCTALGSYEGPMRGLILAYKERGAHRLAGPLGTHLARVIVAAAEVPVGVPIIVVPVPATAAARRARHGDHMSRLGTVAVRALRRAGRPAAPAYGLVARPKADSSHLSAQDRAVTAVAAFRPKPAVLRRIASAAEAGARVIVIDDILTTGSTVAAVAAVLRAAGVRVDGAAVLAATRRRVYPIGGTPDRVRLMDTGRDVGVST